MADFPKLPGCAIKLSLAIHLEFQLCGGLYARHDIAARYGQVYARNERGQI
jgi:hypothetical protein